MAPVRQCRVPPDLWLGLTQKTVSTRDSVGGRHAVLQALNLFITSKNNLCQIGFRPNCKTASPRCQQRIIRGGIINAGIYLDFSAGLILLRSWYKFHSTRLGDSEDYLASITQFALIPALEFGCAFNTRFSTRQFYKFRHIHQFTTKWSPFKTSPWPSLGWLGSRLPMEPARSANASLLRLVVLAMSATSRL